jgi:Tol biopolymer transport system component
VTIWDDRPNVWAYDLERDALSRLSGPEGQQPVWTPDGLRVTFLSGPFDIVWQESMGSGAAERLGSLTGAGELNSWSPDGKWLAFTDIHPTTSADIWVLSLEGEREVRPFLQTPALEAGGVFSPDGRWIAYDSNESGKLEVYVQAFPGPGARRQVSTEGGRQAVWARNGREIFYRSGDMMMVVAVETEPSFSLSKPKALFEGRYAGGSEWKGYANYDVTADGQSFLMIRSEEETAPTEIHVVLNWAEELRAKAAVDRR